LIELSVPNPLELCAWGCGQFARFFSDKTRKQWTCSRRWQGCPAKLKSGREKYTATMIATYGVPVPMKSPEVEARRRKTNLERYGAEIPLQSQKIFRKYKKTLKDRYGADHVSEVPGVLERADATRTRNGTQGGDLEKKIATCRIRYGVDWPLQNPVVFQKNLNSCFKHKTCILPSGAVVFLQGYEPFVLDHLLANGYKEQDFLWMGKPAFWYVDTKGRNRRYHPDFVLPALGLVIEVKAQKWFDNDRENIIKKARAVQNSGWEFLLAVMGDSLRKKRPNPIQFIPFRTLNQE